MFERNPWREFLAGARGRPPTAVVVLLGGLVLGILIDSFVELRPVAELFRLSPDVWERGQLWRIATYGFVGWGSLSAWTLVELVFVYWIAMELLTLFGEARTRVLLAGGVVVAGLSAIVAQFISDAAGGPRCAFPFWMMQGQNILLAIALPAFATANRYSTVAHTPYLLGLPVPTRWLIPLQLFAAAGALALTRDLGGFVGIATATIWAIRFVRR